MKLSYPNYEVIFALQDENDEALPVVRMIMEKYPDIKSTVIIGMSPSLWRELTNQTIPGSVSIQRSTISCRRSTRLDTTCYG